MQKTFFDGTHRLHPPAATLARIRPLLGRMGITRLSNVTGLDHIGIPVAQACRPNAKSLAVSQGKGLTLECALVSAAMESIESFHAEQVNGPVRWASYAEMQQRFRVADPLALPLADGMTFRANEPLLWMEGEDWLEKETVWSPFDLVHAAYTEHARTERSPFRMTSSGLASGNSLMEAVCHAICEAMERDVTAQFGGKAERLVDLRTVADAACLELLELYRQSGTEVFVWNLTGPLGVPCFEAMVRPVDRRALPTREPAGGYGCHPVRAIALLRALTEAAQSRLTVIAGARDDMKQPEQKEWGKLPKGVVDYGSVPNIKLDTFEEDAALLLGRLAAAGIQRAIVHDLTLPEFGIPVVRVVIPGLRMEKG